jgi:hypothetical protein
VTFDEINFDKGMCKMLIKKEREEVIAPNYLEMVEIIEELCN